MHEERATAQLKASGTIVPFSVLERSSMLRTRNGRRHSGWRTKTSKITPRPTRSTRRAEARSLSANEQNDMLRTWGKCTTCVSKNVGLVVDVSFAVYCYNCFDNTFKIADGEYFLTSF